WVVLSALWIGLVVYLIGPKTYTTPWKAVYEAKHQDGRVGEFDLTKRWMQAQRPDINISQLQKDSDELVTALKSAHKVELDKARGAWLLAVLPPLALLGFGLCIFWIARGFRPRTRPLN